MEKIEHGLKPVQTVHKMLISTTSRMVNEYESKKLVIAHAWPNVFDPSSYMRLFETPISRSGYTVAFSTPINEKAPGVVLTNYAYIGEDICAHLSVLFGKRFDSHGFIEGTGSYQIPDLTSYGAICNPKIPFNSHQPRICFTIPLDVGQFEKIERLFSDPSVDMQLKLRLSACAKFYMQALQNAERNVEVAYLHLITVGEILASFFTYSERDILDEQTLKDLETIRNEIDCGHQIAKRISNRLTSVKKTFTKSLSSLLDDNFFRSPETEHAFSRFQAENIETHIGAAYDLRSRYVHTGEGFATWVEPGRGYDDLQVGTPVVENSRFRKTLKNAPRFGGLERLIRYCLLKFMISKGVLVLDSD